MRNKQLGNVDERLKRIERKQKIHEERDDDRFMKIKKQKKKETTNNEQDDEDYEENDNKDGELPKKKSSKLLYTYDSDESADDESNYNSIKTVKIKNTTAQNTRYYS